jgi:hypothetical protein
MLSVLVLDIPAPPDNLLPRPAHDTPCEVLYRPLPVGMEQIGERADDIVRLAEGDRPVLVLYPAHRRAEVVPLLRLLRRVLGTDRLTGLPSTLPPLAAGVVVHLLRQLAGRLELDAGRAAALLPELERRLTVVCWQRRLAGRRLRSLPFRRGFEVILRPEPSVQRIRATGPPRWWPGPSATAVLRGDGRHLAWLRAVVTAGGLPVPDAAPPEPTVRRWLGASRAAELVVFPLDVAALAYHLAGRLRIQDCSWCGLPGPVGPCAFCGLEPSEADSIVVLA